MQCSTTQKFAVGQSSYLLQELDEVYELLSNKEKDLQLSATIGQRLLSENQALNEKYQQTLRQQELDVDDLEQEAHRLRTELKAEFGNKVLQLAS